MTIKIPTTAVVIGPDEIMNLPAVDHEGKPFDKIPDYVVIWFRSKEEALQFYGQLER